MNTARKSRGWAVWGIGVLAAAVIYVASIPVMIRGIVHGWFPDEGLGSHLVASYLVPSQTLVVTFHTSSPCQCWITSSRSRRTALHFKIFAVIDADGR